MGFWNLKILKLLVNLLKLNVMFFYINSFNFVFLFNSKMDVQGKDEMEERKKTISQLAVDAKDAVTSRIPMMTKSKKEDPYDILVPEMLECLEICVDEEKDGYTTINAEQAKEFRKEILAVAENERMIISRQTLLEWAFLVHDWNRIHIFEDYAKEAGFETTPIHGTLIAAGYEQYVKGLCDVIKKTTGRDLVYAGQTIKFSKPSHAKRFKRGRINWNLEKVVKKDGGIDLRAFGVNLRKQRAIICPFTKLRNRLEKPDSDYITPFTTPANVLERSNIEIKEGERNSSYRCVGKKPGDEIFMMHPAAFIISTVLGLSSRRTGKPEGRYRRMDLQFHNKPELGIFETMIRLPSPPREAEDEELGRSYRYVFEACCIQNNKAIVSGKVICYSKNELKLD